ncbi:hypothetical protein ACMXYQ_07995 [Neptuniibacter sp. PT34_22]|uniref:hypothetical protein n=1 Tax=Neptuniibacter sp. PT34_22 TaxID=3398205 RepID=UPI0039F5BB26
MAELPQHLMKNISDSEVEVLSWSAKSLELQLLIEKDIGPESGVIKFCGVGFVHMQPRISLEGVSIATSEAKYPEEVSPEENESLYILHESWGREFYVVAESIEYIKNV